MPLASAVAVSRPAPAPLGATADKLEHDNDTVDAVDVEDVEGDVEEQEEAVLDEDGGVDCTAADGFAVPAGAEAGVWVTVLAPAPRRCAAVSSHRRRTSAPFPLPTTPAPAGRGGGGGEFGL